MRFSHDTSRLVPGRHYWWTYDASETPSTMVYEGAETNLPHHLWGDEVIPPTVEVEPSPPAWVPPVCSAGQFVLNANGTLWFCYAERPLSRDERYPPPAWPPRIGEIVEVLIATTVNREQWVQHFVTSAPERYADSNEYIRCGDRVISRAGEATSWRWVYRDLSGYVPQGGGQ